MDAQDRVARAYARMVALRRVLALDHFQVASIAETYVLELHGALGHLETLGFDVEEFRIPPDRLDYELVSDSPTTGKVYSEERYVERGLFVAKLEAVLTYFEVKNIQEKQVARTIGFQGPSK